MKSDWTTAKLSEVAEFNPREKISAGSVAKKVSMDKLQPFCRDIPGFEMSVYAGGAKFRNGDTIMARITPCLENGKVSKVNILSDGEVGFGSTEYIVFRAKEGLMHPDFLYYLISSPVVREPAIKSMVGSSGRQRVQTNVLQNLEVTLPPLDIQSQIVSIIRDLDDKIALNSRINDNLQQQARTLFQSWFADCETTDWKKGLLKDVLYLKRDSIKSVNKSASLPYLPIDSIPMNTFAVSEVRPNEEAKSSLVAFHTDDIIIGAMRVYFHRVIPAPFDGITRTTCFTLTPYDPNYFCFSLLLCDQESSIQYAQKTSKGSTMPYAIWDSGLGDMPIDIPPKEIATKFNRAVLPMVRKIQSSFFESRALKELRDALLPRLMSGELDVSGLDL